MSEPAAEASPEAQPVADPEADAHYGHYGVFFFAFWWPFLNGNFGGLLWTIWWLCMGTLDMVPTVVKISFTF